MTTFKTSLRLITSEQLTHEQTPKAARLNIKMKEKLNNKLNDKLNEQLNVEPNVKLHVENDYYNRLNTHLQLHVKQKEVGVKHGWVNKTTEIN
jgi:hypothetical protein